MSLNRNQLGRGPAVVTYNSVKFFSRDDINVRHAQVWRPVLTSMYGEVDKTKHDLAIRFPMRLWGAWENLSTIFPSYAMNPNAGTSVFGASDVTLTVLAKNGDQIVYANAQITKLSDLYLGVDSELFAADVEFTALLKNGANPEDSAAYYALTQGNSYTDSAFAKTNFKKVRFSGTWGSVTGFGAVVGQKGWNVSWNLNLRPVVVDGLGTLDMTVVDMVATAKCIAIGPTALQLEAATTAQLTAHGSLLSANPTNPAPDLTLAGSGVSVVLKAASITEHGYAFGQEPLRIGETVWSTTRGFAAGVPAAVATVG